ncbi:MAG: hypothetical protein V1744_03645 [Candidatus Altiarchaeota archaeon]
MDDSVLDALIVAGLLAIAALVALIIREILKKRAAEEVLAEEPITEPQEKNEVEVAKPPPRQESEPQRLARTEKELGEREARLKAERVKELKERENVIQKREDEEKTPPKQEPRLDELEAQRKKTQELIRKAEERYYAGELEEKSFKMIVSNYQKQLLDLGIQMKKRGGR